MTKKIGFTTTVPVEIILSAGHIPVDLNNVFISSVQPERFIDEAHSAGLPRNCCSWIKGLYTAGVKLKAADEIIAVTNGDCSNTQALAELYKESGIPVHFFSYPKDEINPEEALKKQMERLAYSLGTTLNDAIELSKTTDKIRKRLKVLDRLTYEGEVTGFENHLWQVSSSDFNGDLYKFSDDVDNIIKQASKRIQTEKKLRLGYMGVPPICPSIYEFIEKKNSKIVFNEIQRQFTIPSENENYIKRYIEYTYPYGVMERIADAKEQIQKRKIDGIIHYVQSFCYRHIQDILIKKYIPCPVLTIEGDTPGMLDERTKIRIDSFIEMLISKKDNS